jgi:hypothetical protein
MKKTLITLITVTLLLLVISLSSSKLNPSSTSETKSNAEVLEDHEIVTAEKTENSEAKTCPSQNPDEGDSQLGESQQNNPTGECPENLDITNYGENTVPPDGRIYYPTSSEAPYAYTPTNTPKEWKMPLAPPEPES